MDIQKIKDTTFRFYIEQFSSPEDENLTLCQYWRSILNSYLRLPLN